MSSKPDPGFGVGFVLLIDLRLTSRRLGSHSVDFASLRLPQHHIVSSANGIQDLKGLVNFWSEIPLCRMGMYMRQLYYNYKLILSEHELAFILKVRIFDLWPSSVCFYQYQFSLYQLCEVPY